MKSFVTLPKNSVFQTFFTDENIALAESLGEVIWNEKSVHLTHDEIAEKIGDSDIYVTGWGSPRLDLRRDITKSLLIEASEYLKNGAPQPSLLRSRLTNGRFCFEFFAVSRHFSSSSFFFFSYIISYQCFPR